MARLVAVKAGVPGESAQVQRIINLDEVTQIVEDPYGMQIHFSSGLSVVAWDLGEKERFLKACGLDFNSNSMVVR